ncbi:MAG: sortase [Clostridia bacterium]
MNQILYTGNKTENILLKKKTCLFKFVLYFSITILLSSIAYFTVYLYDIKKQEKLASNLINSFNIDSLYSNNKDYTIVKLNNSNEANIIGIIKIDKINIEYPIFSKTTDELLKISPCKFFGPEPNKVGNLCIAGHNFNDERFFSKLSSLKIGDVIEIYAPANVCVYYEVYDMYEIEKNDMNCTSQETNGKKEITLITCNNINKKRLIVKAQEIKQNAH